MALVSSHLFWSTLPETNIAPENQWLEDEHSFWDGLFSGATLVSGSVCLMGPMTLCATAHAVSAHRKNRRSSYGDRQSIVRFGRSKASEVLGELSVKEVQVGFPEGQPTSD